jgi:hypothetical protein
MNSALPIERIIHGARDITGTNFEAPESEQL